MVNIEFMGDSNMPWKRHDMDTFPILLGICGGSPRAVIQTFDVSLLLA